MAHIVAECSRMAQNGRNWPKLLKMPKSQKSGPIGPEWPKLAKMAQIEKIAQSCQNGPEWTELPIGGQNCPIDPEWLKWAKIAQSGPDRAKLVQNFLSGLQWPRVLLKYICQKICPVCKVVSCTNTKTTPPPLFPVDTRCTRWADKVAQEGKGGRWDAGWQM